MEEWILLSDYGYINNNIANIMDLNNISKGKFCKLTKKDIE